MRSGAAPPDSYMAWIAHTNPKGRFMTKEADFHWIHASRAAALVRPGDGGTIVIVPGAMSDASGWLRFAIALDTDQPIAIVNRRGRAPSGDMPLNSTVVDEVDDLREILSRLQGPFTLVGWSYGGLLALEAAVGRADIRSIILYEPVCRPFAPGAAAPIRDAVARGDLDLAVTLVIEDVSGSTADQLAALRASPAWDYLKPLAIPAGTELAAMNGHAPDFAGYAAIEAPVTIIVGGANEHREPYGVAADRFIDAMPDAATAILGGQGHLAHIEAPELLADAARSAMPG